MPQRDGRGPGGMGPRTGRGRGWCRRSLYPASWFRRNRFGFVGGVMTLAGVVIKDVMNPTGVLRTLRKKLLADMGTRETSKESKAQYRVIDEEKTQP